MSEIKRSVKLWAGLGLAASVAAGNAAAMDHAALKTGSAAIQLADASGEGGEGGEGEGAISPDRGNDDASFLTQLALIEGHLTVGVALYEQGDATAAATHMKHPGDELYGDLKPMLEARKLAGFESELGAVAKAVADGRPAAEVRALQDALSKTIAKNLPEKLEAALAAQVVAKLMGVAAEEFAVGVKDGKIVEAHEYQDAWGFTEVARKLLAGLPKAERDEHAADIAAIEKELEAVKPLWPDIGGKQPPPDGAVQKLATAASSIELTASSIK